MLQRNKYTCQYDKCHVVVHEVMNWDKVASFVDSEMKVPTCISLFRQMHLHPTLLSTYSSPSLVCWPTSKRFGLPELLQSACKIFIATGNNVQTTLASLLPRLTDKRLFVFGAGRYNCEGVPCFFYDILVCTMSEIQ